MQNWSTASTPSYSLPCSKSTVAVFPLLGKKQKSVCLCTCWQIAALSQPSQQICDRAEGAQNTRLIKFAIRLISTRWKDEHWSNEHSIFICLKEIHTKTYLQHFLFFVAWEAQMSWSSVSETCVSDLRSFITSLFNKNLSEHISSRIIASSNSSIYRKGVGMILTAGCLLTIPGVSSHFFIVLSLPLTRLCFDWHGCAFGCCVLCCVAIDFYCALWIE